MKTITRTKPVGQTKDAGWQVGARRTFAVSPERAWEVLMSAKGRAVWLGDSGDFKPEAGAAFTTADGAVGGVRVHSDASHIRLTWQPKGWRKASTIQVRVLPVATGTTISFHHEHLASAAVRSQMRGRWQGVLDALAELFA